MDIGTQTIKVSLRSIETSKENGRIRRFRAARRQHRENRLIELANSRSPWKLLKEIFPETRKQTAIPTGFDPLQAQEKATQLAVEYQTLMTTDFIYRRQRHQLVDSSDEEESGLEEKSLLPPCFLPEADFASYAATCYPQEPTRAEQKLNLGTDIRTSRHSLQIHAWEITSALRTANKHSTAGSL